MRLDEKIGTIETINGAYNFIKNYNIKHALARNPYYVETLTIEDKIYINAAAFLDEIAAAACSYNETVNNLEYKETIKRG